MEWTQKTSVVLLSQCYVIKQIVNAIACTIGFFTITAEILVHSLANFNRQYADRHMNLKFVRCVSERERAIRPFVIVKNKLMSVFNESVLLLTMNFIIRAHHVIYKLPTNNGLLMCSKNCRNVFCYKYSAHA